MVHGNRVTGRDGCLVGSKHSGEEGRFGECPSLWDMVVVKGVQEACRKKRVGNEATDMKVSGCDPKSGGQSLLDLISTQ